MAKVIAQKSVTKFCKLSAAIKKAEKRKKDFQKEILDGLFAGAELPIGGPWVIALAQNGGKESVDFEQLYEDILTKIKSKKLSISEKVAREMVKAELTVLKDSMPDKPVVTIAGTDYVGGVKLNVRPNDKYRVVESLEEKAVA